MAMKGGDAGPRAQTSGGERRAPAKFKREERLASVGEHIELVYRVIRHEIAYLEASGEVQPGLLTAEEVVDSMLLRAQRELPGAAAESSLRAWLIRRALEQLQAEVKRLQAESERKVYLEIDSSELPTDPTAVLLDELPYFYEPNELNVEEVVPDPGAPTPQMEARRQELWACASRVLASMPSETRRALMLYHVERLTATELAQVLDKPLRDITQLLERARKDYRAQLVAAGCRPKDGPAPAL